MQLDLPQLCIPAARPLVPVEACMVLLDRDEDDILSAIDSGVIHWAWDIASPGAARREIRIWRDSLLALLQHTKEREADEGQVLSGFLPQRDIRTTEIQRWFSCSSTHVHAMLDQSVFTEVRRPAALSGPMSYSVVSRGSVVAFLQARRVR